MLVIKLDIEHNKENYNAALRALCEFNIASAAWETEEPPTASVENPADRSGKGLSSAVSAMVQQARNNG